MHQEKIDFLMTLLPKIRVKYLNHSLYDCHGEKKTPSTTS